MTTPWLAATPHAPRTHHNILLVEHLPRLLETLPDGADRWFLERCTGAVRLRFRGSPRTLRPHLLRWGLDVLDTGAAEHLTVGSYSADVSRYGGPAAMGVATAFLHADSNVSLTQLRLAEAGVLTLTPSTLAQLSRADLARAWYDHPVGPAPVELRRGGPSRQFALLTPWWQRCSAALRR